MAVFDDKYRTNIKTWVGYANETGPIVESTDGIAPATWPTLPTVASAFTMIGVADYPGQARGLNNSKGFGIGSSAALVTRRGTVQPTVDISFAIGSLGFAKKFFRTTTSGVESLQDMCIAVGQSGYWTRVFRMAKGSNIEFTFSPGSQVMARANLSAIGSYVVGAYSLTTSDEAALRALKKYFFYDLRTLSVGGYNLRDYLSSLSVSLNNSVTRSESERQNWGDNVSLSRTNHVLRLGQKIVGGTIGLSALTPPNLIDGAICAQEWGDVTIPISDTPCSGVSGDITGFNLNVTSLLITDEQSPGGAAGQSVMHNLPFAASDMTCTDYGT